MVTLLPTIRYTNIRYVFIWLLARGLHMKCKRWQAGNGFVFWFAGANALDSLPTGTRLSRFPSPPTSLQFSAAHAPKIQLSAGITWLFSEEESYKFLQKYRFILKSV